MTDAFVKCEFPFRKSIITTSPGNSTEMLLKSIYTKTVNRILGQMLVDINHGKNGPLEKLQMCCHFQGIAVKLLPVSAGHCESQLRLEPWQQYFEVRMALTNGTFVK